MLKVILVAFFIAGCTCTQYYKKSDRVYIQKTITDQHAFPRHEEILNSGLQEFNVIRVNDEVIFNAADTAKTLSLKTKYGTLFLMGFKFSFSIEGEVIVLRFDCPEHEYLKRLYIRTNVYTTPEECFLVRGPREHLAGIILNPLAGGCWETTDNILDTNLRNLLPEQEQLLEHAKTHAVISEPLTAEQIENLSQQTNIKTRRITLGVQWILDLLNNPRKPLYTPHFQDGMFVYLSPPIVMDGEVLKKVTFLTRDMDSTSDEECVNEFSCLEYPEIAAGFFEQF